jgi:two-component system sensor histidine kinase CreC
VSKRNRIFAGILLIYALGVATLMYRMSADLDPRYKESAEESLVDTANLLAVLIENDIASGDFHPARLRPTFDDLYRRELRARIYDVEKTHVDLRVYVTDRNGAVVFDSLGRDEGRNFGDWRDVRLTLRGEYGARTTPDVEGDHRTAVMYVGAPIRWNGQIVGAVSVGKPIQSFGQFIAGARQKLLLAGVTAGASVLVLAVLVSVWLVRPFGLVSDIVGFVRSQKRMSLPRLSRRALGAIGAAFDEMRDALAGRNRVEEYVQTLTHEIKSPLSAIRGAAELLQEPMPEERRVRFVDSIRDEAARIQELVNRLLELASLEQRRGLADLETVPLDELLSEAVRSLAPVIDARAVRVRIEGAQGLRLQGDRFLLHRAVSNLLHNAVDFSPSGGEVAVSVSAGERHCSIAVRDHGPGIPDYALARVFDKFYSLRRPDSGRKGTGLGLAFVKEIAALHRGRATLSNHPEGGAEAVLTLPRG